MSASTSPSTCGPRCWPETRTVCDCSASTRRPSRCGSTCCSFVRARSAVSSSPSTALPAGRAQADRDRDGLVVVEQQRRHRLARRPAGSRRPRRAGLHRIAELTQPVDVVADGAGGHAEPRGPAPGPATRAGSAAGRAGAAAVPRSRTCAHPTTPSGTRRSSIGTLFGCEAIRCAGVAIAGAMRASSSSIVLAAPSAPGVRLELARRASRLAKFWSATWTGTGQHRQRRDDLLELLHGAQAAGDAAVADEADRLVLPLAVQVVEGVLQRRAERVVVLGHHEHDGVGAIDDRAPLLGVVVLVLPERGWVGSSWNGRFSSARSATSTSKPPCARACSVNQSPMARPTRPGRVLAMTIKQAGHGRLRSDGILLTCHTLRNGLDDTSISARVSLVTWRTG